MAATGHLKAKVKTEVPNDSDENICDSGAEEEPRRSGITSVTLFFAIVVQATRVLVRKCAHGCEECCYKAKEEDEAAQKDPGK